MLIRPLSLGALGLAMILLAATGKTQRASEIPSTTEDRLSAAGWWPTKASAPASAFAGDAACAKCHAGEALRIAANHMSDAAFPGAGTAKSGKPAAGTFQSGSYLYRFLSSDAGYQMAVMSPEGSLAADVSWTFGAGVHGQTYLLQSKQDIYESQASSFTKIHALEMTPGHHPAVDGSLQGALGNRLTAHDAERCFACHSTYWAGGGKLDTAHVVPGVHCEACHGPGVAHVAAASQGNAAKLRAAIFDPGKLSPSASIDFCGACHRTTMDVVLNSTPAGVSNLRFQPYRLQKSACWLKTEDARLTCTACHNPHGPLEQDATAYDANCLSCHNAQTKITTQMKPGSAARRILAHPRVCPKATAQCVTCHMAKYDVPEMHSQFTDHFIRIVRPGGPLPK